MKVTCEDLARAAKRKSGVVAQTHGCEECLQSGSFWVHLRLCLSCGHVGCCDESPNKHATRHFHATAHPLIRSFEPGEAWAYCYQHDAVTLRLPVLPGEVAPVHYEAPRS